MLIESLLQLLAVKAAARTRAGTWVLCITASAGLRNNGADASFCPCVCRKVFLTGSVRHFGGLELVQIYKCLEDNSISSVVRCAQLCAEIPS